MATNNVDQQLAALVVLAKTKPEKALVDGLRRANAIPRRTAADVRLAVRKQMPAIESGAKSAAGEVGRHGAFVMHSDRASAEASAVVVYRRNEVRRIAASFAAEGVAGKDEAPSTAGDPRHAPAYPSRLVGAPRSTDNRASVSFSTW